MANGKPGRPKVIEPNFTAYEYRKVEKELQDYYKIKYVLLESSKKRLDWIDSQLTTLASVDYSGMPKATGTKPENYKTEELISEKILLENQIESNDKMVKYVDSVLNTLSLKYQELLIESVAKPQTIRLHEYLLLQKVSMSRNTFVKHRKRAIGQYIQNSAKVNLT